MPPRPKKPSEKQSSRLLEVVKFLSCVTTDVGAPNETHILLSNKTATAFNGTVGAGALIDEDINCAPHAKTFLNALSKCGEQYSLTQLDKSLKIKSGKFTATIPCIDPGLLYFPNPDPRVAELNDSFKQSLSLIEKIKPENGQRVVTLSFLMNGRSVVATDGKMIVEAWHGLNLPPDLPVPKACIPAILNNKTLTGFGFSDSTVTFYFNDNSFVRSQLYKEKWPSLTHIMDKEANLKPVPADFFKGLETLLPFSENHLYFKDGILATKKEDGIGATYEVAGIVAGIAYNPKYLILLKDIATEIDFNVDGPHAKNSMLLFKGINVRGALMGIG